MGNRSPGFYIRLWLFVFALYFLVGIPFVYFLHFFDSSWLHLLLLSTALATSITLAAQFVKPKT